VKKYLWIIALLFVVIGVPRARSYTPTFTCTDPCAGGTPFAPDVSFPSPTIMETWDGFTLAVNLDAFAHPSDTYSFSNSVFQDGLTTYTYLFFITDTTTLTEYGTFAPSQTVVPTALAPLDQGTLGFSSGSGTTPEPSSWVYAITGMCFLGFLVIKLKAL
jgi:hypothetical protein